MPDGCPQFWKLVSELEHCGMTKLEIHTELALGEGTNCMASLTSVATGRSNLCTLAEAIDVLQAELLKRRPEQAAPANISQAGGDRGGGDRDGAASAIPVTVPNVASEAVEHTSPQRATSKKTEQGISQQQADTFANGVKAAAAKFSRKEAVPTNLTVTPLPKGYALTLSQWYTVVKSVDAFPFSAQPALKKDQEARAALLGEEVRRVFGATQTRVSLWMFDGAGNIVFQLLRFLSKEWSGDDIDARLELTLVDWNKAMNAYHEWAIPCAKVLRGSIHEIISNPKIIDRKNPPRLPQVAYFNYSITTTSGTTKDQYEVYPSGKSSFPGSKYSTPVCMSETAESCKKLLKAFPSAGLLVGFSMVRAAASNAEKFIAATQNAELTVKEDKTCRQAFATWTVVAQ